MSNLLELLPGEELKRISFKRKTKSREYFISNYGRLFSSNKITGVKKLMKSTLTKRGYPKVSLKLDGGYESVYIHKAVGECFVAPEGEHNTFLIHIDYNRSNNKAENLKWVTEFEQKDYIRKRGEIFDYKKSTGGGYFKLTAPQVSIIKKALMNGKTRKKMLAKRFGVTSTQIKRIERGENWANVEPAE